MEHRSLLALTMIRSAQGKEDSQPRRSTTMFRLWDFPNAPTRSARWSTLRNLPERIFAIVIGMALQTAHSSFGYGVMMVGTWTRGQSGSTSFYLAGDTTSGRERGKKNGLRGARRRCLDGLLGDCPCLPGPEAAGTVIACTL